MTMRINSTQGVGFEAQVSSAEMPESSTEINFSNYGPDENYIQSQNTKERAEKFIKANKSKFELVQPLFFGSDHFKVKGDGKMTYGQLREMLGIPPKVLSETNGKRLKDSDIVENAKINLSDIGWYLLMPETEWEAVTYRSLRNNGDNHAGYDRSVSNDDIINWFKK